MTFLSDCKKFDRNTRDLLTLVEINEKFWWSNKVPIISYKNIINNKELFIFKVTTLPKQNV